MRKKTETMRFCRIHLGNWMNFQHTELDVQNRVFLVGPNASGKSNFLDALRFLRDLAVPGGGFQQAVNRRGGVSAIRCLAARRYSDVEISFTVQLGDDELTWDYELAFNQDNQRRPKIQRENVKHGNELLLERPNEEDRQDPDRLTQTYLEQVNVNRPFRMLATCLTSIRYLHIVPQLIRDPDRSIGRSNDPFGGDFLEQVAKTPEKTQNARLGKIKEALKVAVPQLDDVQMKRDSRGTPHLRGKYAHWRPQGAWQNEDQFSDGTLRLIGLLWVAMEGKGPLLLEEPELSLHPEIIRYLPQMFARVSRSTGRQIFVSTHSPDLLRDDGIGLNEVILLKPETEGTRMMTADSVQNIRQLLEGGMSIADVVIPNTRPDKADQLPLFGDV
jgi:predicted ATPase